MITLDLRKELKAFYAPSAKKVELLEVPCFQYIMIDGRIEPGQGPGTSPGFQEAMEALYGAAYTLKFMSKQRRENPIDYPVMALEGLWWIEEGEFDLQRKDNWVYTVMILQPEHINEEMFSQALGQLRKKKGDQPVFGRLRLEAWEEGLCIQTMHIGPYASEPATMAKMEIFAQEQGLVMQGRHHEIYLVNPLRADPAKLKTILRHQVAHSHNT